MNDQMFEEQIGLICRNEKEGLRRIYEDYNPLIYSVVVGILHNKEDAEDVTSEFFIRLWKQAQRYRPGQGHRAWMITIAHNMSIDFLRKHKKEYLVDELPEMVQPGQESYEEQLCQKLSLEQAMNTLKEEERQVVHLKIMGELTFREIAAIMGIPAGTAAWRYQTAIRKLKRCGYDR
ncbi:MAG: RNA polymerase sigma factor [Lachnospiraceae bacterium]